MIKTLKQLKIFEDSCLNPQKYIPPEKDFGTYDYKTLASTLGGHDLRNMIEVNFNREFNRNLVQKLLDNIDKLKSDILELKKDNNLIHRNLPVFPIKYDKTRSTPIYITPEELSPDQFEKNSLYSQVNVLPYNDDKKSGLNYPEFQSVIRNLKTDLIPQSNIIIQNVLGNGECLFRSLINGYHYSERGVNLGFNPVDSNLLVNNMKLIFLQVLEFCLSDKKTQHIFNCSDRFYQTFMELIQQEYFERGKMTFEHFKENYLNPNFYGGPFECNLFSQLFNYRVNLFSRERKNNKFTFNETFDNRVNKSRDNYGQTINVLNVGGHFMVIYTPRII